MHEEQLEEIFACRQLGSHGCGGRGSTLDHLGFIQHNSPPAQARQWGGDHLHSHLAEHCVFAAAWQSDGALPSVFPFRKHCQLALACMAFELNPFKAQ